MTEQFMNTVLTKLDEHSEEFKKINAKLEDHDGEFKKINAKLEDHDEEFKKINAKLENHDEKIEKLEKSDAGLTRELENVYMLLKEMTRKQDERYETLHRSLLIIEDKVSRELPALFDGYKINIEKTTDLEIRHNSLEENVELNSMKISNLEEISKTHDNQLSKLLASNS